MVRKGYTMKFKKYIFIVLGILALSVFVTILSTVFIAFFEIINNIIGTEPVIEATPKLSLTVFGVSISICLALWLLIIVIGEEE